MRIFVVMTSYDGGETTCDGVFRDPKDASDCLGEEWCRRDNSFEDGRPGSREFSHAQERGQFVDAAPGVTDGSHSGSDGNGNETSFTFKDGLFVGFQCDYGFTGCIEEKELT